MTEIASKDRPTKVGCTINGHEFIGIGSVSIPEVTDK